MSLKRHTKYRLLLDEGVHLPHIYPRLNNLHDLLHVYQVNLKGASDEKVFSFAKHDSRMMVVFNIRDFKKFIKADSPTVISLSTKLKDEQADLKICKALKSLKPSEKTGHLISITQSGIKTMQVFNN